MEIQQSNDKLSESLEILGISWLVGRQACRVCLDSPGRLHGGGGFELRLRRVGVSQACEDGEGAPGQRNIHGLRRHGQSIAMLGHLLWRAAGVPGSFPLSTPPPHCMCGFDVPRSPPFIPHSISILCARHRTRHWVQS